MSLKSAYPEWGGDTIGKCLTMTMDNSCKDDYVTFCVEAPHGNVWYRFSDMEDYALGISPRGNQENPLGPPEQSPVWRSKGMINEGGCVVSADCEQD